MIISQPCVSTARYFDNTPFAPHLPHSTFVKCLAIAFSLIFTTIPAFPAPIHFPLQTQNAADISQHDPHPISTSISLDQQLAAAALAHASILHERIKRDMLALAILEAHYPGLTSRDQHQRVRRSNEEVLKYRDNYPQSPVEAFFGNGANTHQFGLSSGTLFTPTAIGNHIDMPLKDGTQLNVLQAYMQARVMQRFNHGQEVSTVNNFNQIDWEKMYDQYQSQLDAQGGKAPAYEYTPTYFFGKSPFDHNVKLGGGMSPMPFRVGNAIDVPNGDSPSGRLGLVQNSNFQPETVQYGYGHTLDGVNNYDQIDWDKQFDRFIDRHANYVLGGEADKVMASQVPKAPTVEPPKNGSSPAGPAGPAGPGVPASPSAPNVPQTATASNTPVAAPQQAVPQQQGAAGKFTPQDTDPSQLQSGPNATPPPGRVGVFPADARFLPGPARVAQDNVAIDQLPEANNAQLPLPAAGIGQPESLAQGDSATDHRFAFNPPAGAPEPRASAFDPLGQWGQMPQNQGLAPPPSALENGRASAEVDAAVPIIENDRAIAEIGSLQSR